MLSLCLCSYSLLTADSACRAMSGVAGDWQSNRGAGMPGYQKSYSGCLGDVCVSRVLVERATVLAWS